MVEIRRTLVNANMYNIKCPYEMDAEFIVVHNTANDSSASNEIKYMINNTNKVSFHYAVDDKEIVQGIPVNRNSWNAGDGGNGKGNRKGIAIEICYSKSGGERFIQAEKNAAEFIASLLSARGWGIDRVKKHQDFTNKYCPHRTLDMGWDRFLNMIKAHIEVKPVEQPKPTLAHKVGETVKINGVYTSSTSETRYNPAYTTGTITKIVEGARNPYLLNDGGLGWVNDDCIVTTTAAKPSVEYYPIPNYKGSSIVDALNSIGVDSSYNNRKKIAQKNNIRDYTGTAQQNNQMLAKLKAGKLIR